MYLQRNRALREVFLSGSFFWAGRNKSEFLWNILLVVLLWRRKNRYLVLVLSYSLAGLRGNDTVTRFRWKVSWCIILVCQERIVYFMITPLAWASVRVCKEGWSPSPAVFSSQGDCKKIRFFVIRYFINALFYSPFLSLIHFSFVIIILWYYYPFRILAALLKSPLYRDTVTDTPEYLMRNRKFLFWKTRNISVYWNSIFHVDG